MQKESENTISKDIDKKTDAIAGKNTAQKEPSIRIYAMTHRKFTEPTDPLYVPLQVGSALHPDLGYLSDNTGVNISKKNIYYSELTGHYWLWKNVTDVDYIGTCHYRRYLLNEKDLIFTRSQLLDLLADYDVITSKCIELDYSYHYGFSDNHNVKDLDETGEVIREICPEYYDTFIKLVNENHTYFGNIFVMKKSMYDEYCSWLFGIFAELEHRIDADSYDSYHKRVYGFISEFLLYVWVTVNHLKAYECKVGLIGEKVETAEMKKNLTEYFNNRDLDGAKEYFLAYQKKRPDVLMEASDVTGDLRVAMQVIATAQAERSATGSCILDRNNEFADLVRDFKILNSCILRFKTNRNREEDYELLRKMRVSSQAVRISILTFCKEERERVSSQLKEFI